MVPIFDALCRVRNPLEFQKDSASSFFIRKIVAMIVDQSAKSHDFVTARQEYKNVHHVDKK